MRVLYFLSNIVSVHRLWDIVENDSILSLDIMYFEDDNIKERLERSIRLVSKVADVDYNSLLARVNFVPIQYTLELKLVWKIIRTSHGSGFTSFLCRILSIFIYPLFMGLNRIIPIKRGVDFHRYDKIICGGNNFDRSNIVFPWLYFNTKSGSELIRTYKESSGNWSIDEFLMLKLSKVLVFPTTRHEKFYRELYSIDFSSKSILIADEDWRYSRLIEFFANKPSKKEVDIAILSGRLTNSTNRKISDYRYNYLKYLWRYSGSGLTLDVYTMRIKSGLKDYLEVYDTIDGTLYTGGLDLESNFNDYLKLSEYRAGVLHVEELSASGLNKFQMINIPNRFYEYQMLGLWSIVSKGNLSYLLGKYSDFIISVPNGVVSRIDINKPISGQVITRSFKDYFATII